jgi:hypothetical protein
VVNGEVVHADGVRSSWGAQWQRVQHGQEAAIVHRAQHRQRLFRRQRSTSHGIRQWSNTTIGSTTDDGTLDDVLQVLVGGRYNFLAAIDGFVDHRAIFSLRHGLAATLEFHIADGAGDGRIDVRFDNVDW